MRKRRMNSCWGSSAGRKRSRRLTEAVSLDGTLTQPDRITLALLRKRDDTLRDQQGRRIVAVHRPELLQRFLALACGGAWIGDRLPPLKVLRNDLQRLRMTLRRSGVAPQSRVAPFSL